MSLDQNLFTLFFKPNTSYPTGNVIDLTDPSGTVHYRKHRISSQQQVYRIELSEPLSEALLASATAPSATSKHKTVELYNPSNIVELKYTGTLTFRWSFKWETHEFEWKREECFMIRKPDPPVLVAVTKEPPGRIRTVSVQILDYNLNRFDIEDRKGLEIVILTALLTFQDSSDAYHEPSSTTASTTPSTTATTPSAGIPSTSDAPKPPPKPAPKKGVERIAELQLGRGQVNEVTVLEEGTVADYAKHCVKLLQDDAMLFISVRSSDPDKASKVLHVVEKIKRLHHKAGNPDLHQYVLYDSSKEGVTAQNGRRIINPNDDDNGKGKNSNKGYTPPQSLTVHLSKIDMPEFRPRGAPSDGRQLARRDQDSGKKKEKEKDSSKRATMEKATKGKDKDKDGHGKSRQTSAPPRQSTSPPRSPALHKRRSQPLMTTSSSLHVQSPPPPPPRRPGLRLLASSGVPPSYYHYSLPPALPPRLNNSPRVPVRPQTMYGHPYAVQGYYMYQDGNRGVLSGSTNPHGNSPSSSSSGLLGRLLGR